MISAQSVTLEFGRKHLTVWFPLDAERRFAMGGHHAASNRTGHHALVAINPASPPMHSSLPIPLTRLIGRDAEVAALRHALVDERVRLFTLTGAGGTGKTRLAIAVAAAAATAFPDGTYFVDLAPVREPDLVVPTIATTFGLRESADRSLRAGLGRFLATKRLLLLLDNCEHVLAASLEIAAMLGANPDLTVLATSRAPLRIRGEREFPLPPLDTPKADLSLDENELAAMPAVALFVERAGECQPDFALTAENAADVAAICRRLDGLPLAIELAATRIKILPPAALLARLEPRLPLLSGGGRDLPARQRTMRDSVAWSYDLLSPAEQAAFRRLCVFVGGFTIEGAEAIVERCGTPSVLDLLASLVDKGLVRRSAGSGEPRFAMLETIREYGLERLEAETERETAHRRHAAYFLTVAERAEPRLRGPDQALWSARLETEHDNLRAALAWLLAEVDRAEDALRLGGALHWFWYLRGHHREGLRWLEASVAFSREDAPSSARVRALAGAGLFASHLADYPRSRARLRESLAIGRTLGNASDVAYALHILAFSELLHMNHEELQAIAEESVSLFRLAGDRWGVANALCLLGMVLIVSRDPAAAAAPLDESLTLARELGDTRGIARALHYTGEVARFLGDDERARPLYAESLHLYRELDDRSSAAIVLDDLGYVAAHQGDPRRALASFLEALGEHTEAAALFLIAHSLAGIAGVATMLHRPTEAARLFGASAALCERIGAAIWPVEKVDHDRHLGEARNRLGEAAFAAAFAAGRELPTEEAIAAAFTLGDEIATSPSSKQAPTPSRPQTNPFGLSPREREVLRLLTCHATDREIADQLSISPRTVMHHVSSILAKLGVDNRRHAAILAARHGIG
jgi:predicted ATPase/DNA-binding CsgD family transcriptional regulator